MRRRISVLKNSERALPADTTRLAPPSGVTFEATIDGSRLCIGAKDEVVIQCGKASITLRRNGRLIIRGTHVETNSSGTNRIKGGLVRVN